MAAEALSRATVQNRALIPKGRGKNTEYRIGPEKQIFFSILNIHLGVQCLGSQTLRQSHVKITRQSPLTPCQEKDRGARVIQDARKREPWFTVGGNVN